MPRPRSRTRTARDPPSGLLAHVHRHVPHVDDGGAVRRRGRPCPCPCAVPCLQLVRTPRPGCRSHRRASRRGRRPTRRRRTAAPWGPRRSAGRTGRGRAGRRRAGGRSTCPGASAVNRYVKFAPARTAVWVRRGTPSMSLRSARPCQWRVVSVRQLVGEFGREGVTGGDADLLAGCLAAEGPGPGRGAAAQVERGGGGGEPCPGERAGPAGPPGGPDLGARPGSRIPRAPWGRRGVRRDPRGRSACAGRLGTGSGLRVRSQPGARSRGVGPGTGTG